jgi:hypothetical protein
LPVVPDTTVTPLASETATVRCPYCGTAFSSVVSSIVDAADARARADLLAGRLNQSACPRCGQANRVVTPVLYFDATMDVALVVVPGELGLTHADQERRIGQLANRALASLPVDQRRMYLLQPRTFVTEATFLEAVLEANGVTAADRQRMQEATALIERLIDAPDDATVKAQLTSVGRDGDHALPALAHALARDAAARGDARRAATLEVVRDRLARVIVPAAPSLDDLIAELRQAHADGHLDAAVGALRPILDYGFFAALTDRIDRASPPDAGTLSELRTALLAAIDAIDDRATADLRRGAEAVQRVLRAPDPVTAVRALGEGIDDAFLIALRDGLEQADARGETHVASRLAAVFQAAVETLEASLPARDRLINLLARADAADARRNLIDGHRDLLDADLVRVLRESAVDLRAAGAGTVGDNLTAAADDIERRLQPGLGKP